MMILTFLVTKRMKMMDLDEFHYHLFARFKSSHRKPEMGGMTMILSDLGVKKPGQSRNTLVLFLVPVMDHPRVRD